jgi:hypothetical protein
MNRLNHVTFFSRKIIETLFVILKKKTSLTSEKIESKKSIVCTRC